MSVRMFWFLIAAGSLLLFAYAWSRDFCLNCIRMSGHHHHAGEYRSPSVYLKGITSAQADFRANDRDGDGVTQFWRADIAGLYVLAPGGGPAIRLIDPSVALADDRPVSDLSKVGPRAPSHGYWFRALRHADENTLDAKSRFAAECHPADYPKPGRWTFIVDENNTLFRADLGHGRGIDVYPTDDDLKTKWTKVD
jgi:hypothetical protein